MFKYRLPYLYDLGYLNIQEMVLILYTYGINVLL